MDRVLIVLGCAVWPDALPSPALLRRTRKAAQLWHRGGFERIITSGGVGHYPPSEAEVMRRILISEGVPAEAIVLEDRSTSTRSNARFSLTLLGSTNSKITVVTDGYHRLRAGLIFRDLGHPVTTISSDDCPPRPRLAVRLRQILREIAALSWYLLRHRRAHRRTRESGSGEDG